MPQDIQILRAGSFRDDFGEFEITPEHLASMEDNFQKRVFRQDLMLDYSHETWGKAAGWFTDIYTDEGGQVLRGKVKWTKAGSQAVLDQEFRYTSADVHFNFQDNEKMGEFGPTLLGAALTNRPFIKDMEPTTQLSEQQREKERMKLEDLQKQMSEVEGRLKNIEGENKQLSEDNKKLSQENADLKKQIAKAEEDKAVADKKAQFDQMLASGKACEAQRDAFMNDDMKAFAENAQPVKLGAAGSSTAGTGEVDLGDQSATEKLIKLADELCEKDKNIGFSEAMKRVRLANPELRKKATEENDVRMA